MASHHCRGQGVLECILILSTILIICWFVVGQSKHVLKPSEHRFSRIKQ
jgi:hypothetical protein